MNQQIKQIAERLKGLREVLDIEVEEIASVCGLTAEQYLQIESGENDIPVSILHQISQHYSMELSTLMFGNEAHMSSYYLTRAGNGPTVERRSAYKYQSLASGFKGGVVTPFLVTVEPDENKELTLNQHNGQEFNMVLKGTMLLHINGKELILNAGDSIYFNSSLPHGMKALEGKQVQFLAVII
ncbi:MAG: cupin domain-containing protein [Bacteroidales bacterium]